MSYRGPQGVPSQHRIIGFMDFWSDVDDVISLTNASADHDLPDVVVEDLPAGFTIQRVVAIIKISAIEDTSASANAVNGAAAIRVMKSTGGWGTDDVAAINIVDNQWTTAASTKEGGDAQVGDNDVSGEVDAEATYNLRFEDIQVDGNNLKLYNVQVCLRVYFY